jgi:hypothetical protein
LSERFQSKPQTRKSHAPGDSSDEEAAIGGGFTSLRTSHDGALGIVHPRRAKQEPKQSRTTQPTSRPAFEEDSNEDEGNSGEEEEAVYSRRPCAAAEPLPNMPVFKPGKSLHIPYRSHAIDPLTGQVVMASRSGQFHEDADEEMASRVLAHQQAIRHASSMLQQAKLSEQQGRLETGGGSHRTQNAAASPNTATSGAAASSPLSKQHRTNSLFQVPQRTFHTFRGLNGTDRPAAQGDERIPPAPTFSTSHPSTTTSSSSTAIARDRMMDML